MSATAPSNPVEPLGLSPEATLALWGWLMARAFDLEWEAYAGGQGAGSGFRRYRYDEAFELHQVKGELQRRTPPLEGGGEEQIFLRLLQGVTRDQAGRFSHLLRVLAKGSSLSVLGIVLPRLHQLLGLPMAVLDAALPPEGEGGEPVALRPVPWADQAPTGLGHPPTVRFWVWLTSFADMSERRLQAEKKRKVLRPDERRALLLRVRVLRLTLADLWRLLPPGEWREKPQATWEGLTRGISGAQAEALEQRLRQAAVDHEARGEPQDGPVARLYELAARRLREAFGLDEASLRERLPTAPAGTPRSLDWIGYLCTPGVMIWSTQEPLTREGFIQRMDRGMGE